MWVKLILAFKDYFGLLFVSISKDLQKRGVIKRARKSVEIREAVELLSDDELDKQLLKHTRVRNSKKNNS